MIFTTSWDDGYALDLRIAQLLTRYGLKGTFYVCPAPQHGRVLLTESQIRELSHSQEIGAHTLTHPKLTQVSSDEADREIRGSKEWVENITGKPCPVFCYPKGAWNPSVRSMVERAGFLGARTTECWKFDHQDPYLLPVTLQVMPFPLRKSWKPSWKLLDPLGPLRAHFGTLRSLGLSLADMRSWSTLAMALFDRALTDNQTFFHLYGHSHEIEKYGMWEEFESFLKHVSGRANDIRICTNSELLQ